MCSFRCFVTKVKDDSPAIGLIPAKSRLYAVDGHDLTQASKQQALDLLQQAGELITFSISAQADLDGMLAFEEGRAPLPPMPPTTPAVRKAAPWRRSVKQNDDGKRKVQIMKGGGSLGMAVVGPKGVQDPREGWLSCVCCAQPEPSSCCAEMNE